MTTTPDKQARFDEFMKFDHVSVHLDSRRSGVQVPVHLKDNASLTLKLSYLFEGEVGHDKEAITAYLKFSGNYEKCVLPWTAIWGMTCSNKQQKIWSEDLPKEMVLALAKEQLSVLASKVFGKRKPSSKPGDETTTVDSPATKKKKESHLKRVK